MGKLKILELGDAKSIHVRRWVQALRARGYEVQQASLRPGHEGEPEAHSVVVLPTYGLGKAGYFLAIGRLRRLVREFRPDVIHAQHVTSYGFLAAWSGCSSVVLTAWGSDILLNPSKSPLHRWLTRFALRRASLVTVPAGFLSQTIRELSGRADARLVPFGIDLEVFKFRPDREPFPRPVLVICTRNLEPVYDHATLLTAFAQVVAGGVDAALTLIGEGSLRGELEAQCRELGISNRVRFLGRLDQASLSTELKTADVFVSASVSDSGPLSLVEAMASGCFPVATRIPANQQWIEEAWQGSLFETRNSEALASALEQACLTPTMRERAALPNRKIVEERADWNGNVSQMEELFSQIP